MDGEGDAFEDLSEYSDSHVEVQELPEEHEAELAQPVPEYSEEELNELLGVVQRMTILYALKDDDWTEDSASIIKTWLLDPNHLMLTIFFDAKTLTASLTYPTMPVYDMTYFLRDPGHIFTIDDFHDAVTFGRIHDDVDGTLLTLMEKVYAPIFFGATEWSENVKCRLCTALHSFLSQMTVLHHKMAAMTVLYIPGEALSREIDEAVGDSALLERLEMVAEYWIEALRMCLSDREQIVPFELMAPVDEFQFWQYRYEVLCAVQHQVRHKDFLHIMAILETSQSVFVKQIRDVIGEIDKEAEKADDNIIYLQLLVRPCGELDECQGPADVPLKLPRIMNIIRYIWLYSRFFNTKDSVTKLFRNLSNQIIVFCRGKVDVETVLASQPRVGITWANTAIDCCLYFKVIYERISSGHKDRHPTFGWELDDALIFNHIDTFMQRLNDFKEICEGFIVFGRCFEGNSVPRPQFGGDRGQEFERTCDEVETQFLAGLNNIRCVSEMVFDVHTQRWYEVIEQYKALVRHLKEIVENLILNVFASVQNVEEGIEALACLHPYSIRRNLRSAYIRETSTVWKMFGGEIAVTNNLLTQQLDHQQACVPHFGGRAIFLKANSSRLTKLRGLFERAEWMPENSNSFEVIENLDQMQSNATRNIKNLYEQWLDTLGTEVISRLNRTLMRRSVTHPGLLECNIDRTIFEICREASCFKMLGFSIPVHVSQLYAKFNVIKVAYDGVLRIMINYNGILMALSEKERLLFRVLLQVCDRVVLSGVYKLTWTNDALDTYVVDCEKHIGDLKDFLKIYRKANEQIVETCQKISAVIVLDIAGRWSEPLEAVQNKMESGRKEKILEILTFYNHIMEMIFLVYDGFEAFMENMIDIWTDFVRKFDSLIEAALMMCARETLKKVYRTLHGDGIVSPTPLFDVDINLVDAKIAFKPPIHQVANFLGSIFNLVVNSVSHFPRLITKLNLTKPKDMLEYHQVIDLDVECLKWQRLIVNELNHNQTQLKAYIEDWMPFSSLWELDGALFMEKFKAQDASALIYDKNIENYSKISNQISFRETSTAVHFLKINSINFKQSIYELIGGWQERYLELLKEKAAGRITDLVEYLRENIELVSSVPKTLDEMQHTIGIYENLVEKIPEKETEIQEIKEIFGILTKHEVLIPPDIQSMRDGLDCEWKEYLDKIQVAEEMLDGCRDSFKLLTSSSADGNPNK